MSHGAFPSFGNIIQESFIEEIIPNLWQELLNFLAETNHILDEVACLFDEQRADNTPFKEDEEKKLTVLWEEIKKTFEEQTGGLTLDIFYFNPESENRYNDIEIGVNFCVGGVFDYTPAGEKYKDKIKVCQWVDFG